MKKALIFVMLLLFSGFVCACGNSSQREKMAEKLFADADMQKFVCARDSCSVQEFADGLKFHRYDVPFREKKVEVCVVEPALSATNSYTGIFSTSSGDFEFQFISYGAGIKVGTNKGGLPMIIEFSPSDPDNPGYSISQYLWNGRVFIFSRTKSFPDGG